MKPKLKNTAKKLVRNILGEDIKGMFHEPTDEMTSEDMVERKKVLWKLILELDSVFIPHLIANRNFYRNLNGKGEIQIFIGKEIKFIYFPLKFLKKMISVSGSDYSLKFSLEYSVDKILENNRNEIIFNVWDIDERTYFYEYNIEDNIITL